MDNKEYIDWSKPDWSREKPRQFWDPGRKLLKSIRDYQRIKASKNVFKFLTQRVCVFRYRFWSSVCGAEIDLECSIGGGLLIPHPNGIVIHPKTKIGVNCLIFQQVTITGNTNDSNFPVEIDYHVDIGAGAKLLAPLKVDAHARIGANAVVTKNVDERTTVVGIPARRI